MRHLSREDLVALVDGGAPSAEGEDHLRSCAHCQGEVAALEVTLRRVRDVEVPEPSPLFWDHLASRVRAAVAREPAPRRAGLTLPGWRWWAPASGLATAVVALVFAMGGPAGSPVAPAPGAVASQAASTTSDDEAADAWALVIEVAASDDWAEDDDLGLEPASAESAATALSAEDQAQLVRVLNEALAKSPI
jgi:hypothetical protein